MAEKVITYTVKVNVDGVEKTVTKAANTMENLNEAVGKYEKMLSQAEVGSKKFNTIKGRLEKLKAAQEKANIASMSFGDAMSSIPGPVGQVSQGVKGLGTALKVLAANPIIAVITVLVGLVVGLFKAFTSTKEGAEKLERVMAGVSSVMDNLRDVVVNLFSSWSNFKKAFTLDFWKNTTKEIAREAKEAQNLTGVLQDVADAERTIREERALQNRDLAKAKRFVDDTTNSYEDRLAKLDEVIAKEEAQLNKELANERKRLKALERLAAQSDSSAEDLNKLTEQRIKLAQLEEQSDMKATEAAAKRRAIEQQRAAERKANYEKAKQQREQAAAFEQKINLELITDADEKAQKQLEIERDARMKEIDGLRLSAEKKQELRNKVEQDFLNDQAELNKKIQDAEDKAADEALKKKQEEAQKERDLEMRKIDAQLALLQMEGQMDIDETIRLMREKTDLILQNDKLEKEERELIEAQYTEAVKNLQDSVTENAKKNAEEEKQLEMEKAAAAANALGVISDAAGKETLVGKAAAVAQAYINTYLGASQVLADEKLPTFLKPFAVAAVIASGLKNVQSILAVQPDVPKYAAGGLVMGSGSDGSDTVDAKLSPGEAVINARSTRMFGRTLSTINQAGGGVPITPLAPYKSRGGDDNGGPIKTYVVSKDMSSQQAFDRATKSRSTI